MKNIRIRRRIFGVKIVWRRVLSYRAAKEHEVSVQVVEKVKLEKKNNKRLLDQEAIEKEAVKDEAVKKNICLWKRTLLLVTAYLSLGAKSSPAQLLLRYHRSKCMECVGRA